MTLTRGAGSKSTLARLRRSRTRRCWRSSVGMDRRRPAGAPSDPHRHDHGDVALVARLSAGAEHGGVELAGDAEDDLVVVDGGEHVEEVLGVEADGELGAVVFDG